MPRWDFGTRSWNSLASFQSGTGQEKQGLFTDPLLAGQTSSFESLSVSGFTLLQTSPAIDRGALISATEGRDFFGVTVPQGARVDIGASEYKAALWTFCAPEGGVCAFTGTTEVRYGAERLLCLPDVDRWHRVYQRRCSAIPSTARGNPARSRIRRPPTEWTVCAAEGGVCAFTGTMEVRYGADGAYVYQTLTDGTACTNDVFGDPIYGTRESVRLQDPAGPDRVDVLRGGRRRVRVHRRERGALRRQRRVCLPDVDSMAPPVPIRCSAIPSTAWSRAAISGLL